MSVELSVVVPVFNEEENLPELYRRLTAVLGTAASSWEILFVDDGSRDRSWEIIRGLAENDPRVRGLRFSRNFGHQMAFAAGLDHARGQAVVIMDADLQDPPELIPQLLAKHREGFEVVYAVRTARHGETFFKRLTAKLFYRLLARITSVQIPLDTGDFRLMGRRAVEAFRRLPERHRFTRGLVAWLGFPQTGVPYERAPRHAGTTKYPLRKMLRFAVDAITSFSHVPLQLATWLGFIVSGFAFFYILVVIALKFAGISWPGYTSIMAAILFLGGVQLVMVGLLGEYVGRIYDEVKHRPLYLVAEEAGSREQGSMRHTNR
ncbi:MAG: glycosyltransferase family 2 protein [Acidobacteriota bacterium]|uniref:Glycosyltransferase n=2 Tax=Thermoanaerobaculum aquaticum TaxID=1312852 RepID=A0A062XSB4_9BACT|nr:glycosyltransferase family 2 protein [Thermoanaerobaculum aquaticum]KDA53733.1 glycosyltransferase [Thermoanaerobaculum aquaticum]